jgi:hypothetical protein
MGQLVSMCGLSLDDAVGRRVSVEIAAREAQPNFISCAEIMGHDLSEFHPRIATILEKVKIT